MARRFTKDLLDEIIERDKALLLKLNNKLNRDSRINFKCKCGKEDERGFRNIFNEGAFCSKCVYLSALQKRNITVKEKYGVDTISQVESVKAKRVVTNIERRGVSGPFASSEVREKCKATCIERYGTEHPLQNTIIMNNLKVTNFERYGVEHPHQNKEVAERAQKNAKKYKSFEMPSGIVRKVQGYEPFALKILVKIYSEEQIKTDRKDVPRVQYEVDGKKKYHFPDIFIPHENKLIEVKSTWTLKCKTDNIKLKKKACEERGFLYEIWCFDQKSNMVKVSI